jgi:hypothetical protein
MAYTKRWNLVHLLGGKCRDCGEENFSVLEIDHIYNDGDTDRKYYSCLDKRYLSNPKRAKERLQILCKQCHENKHHPVIEDYKPFTTSGKMKILYKSIKMLEGTNQNPVSRQRLVRLMMDNYDPLETEKLIRLLQRDASIYESQTGCYNTV